MNKLIVVKDNALIYERAYVRISDKPLLSKPAGSILERIPSDVETIGFYKVKIDGHEGFISKKFVKEIGESFSEKEKAFIAYCILYTAFVKKIGFLNLSQDENEYKEFMDNNVIELMEKLDSDEDTMNCLLKILS